MSTRTEQIRVSDKHGFIHDVTLEHKPHFGFPLQFLVVKSLLRLRTERYTNLFLTMI